MTHRYIKIGLTALVMVMAFSGLLWSTLREGTDYFKNVDEVLTDRQAWEGKSLQLHGYVVPGSIFRTRDSLDYRFQIQNDPPAGSAVATGQIVNASYSGVVPDTFKAEAEVVLKGKLSPDGFQVVPNGVTAKCPSKYEAASQSAATGL